MTSSLTQASAQSIVLFACVLFHTSDLLLTFFLCKHYFCLGFLYATWYFNSLLIYQKTLLKTLLIVKKKKQHFYPGTKTANTQWRLQKQCCISSPDNSSLSVWTQEEARTPLRAPYDFYSYQWSMSKFKTHYITWGRVICVMLGFLLFSANKKTLLDSLLYPKHYIHLIINVIIIKTAGMLRNVKTLFDLNENF